MTGGGGGGGERSGEERGLRGEELAGVCAGVVLGVLVVIALAMVFCWRRHR